MKEKKYALTVTFCLTILLIIFQLLVNGAWWWFVVPTFLTGVLLPPKRMKGKGFISSFTAGTLSWGIPHLYFQLTYPGELFPQIAALIGVPSWVLLIGLGIICGILSGLAFISGVQLRTGREQLKLDLED